MSYEDFVCSDITTVMYFCYPQQIIETAKSIEEGLQLVASEVEDFLHKVCIMILIVCMCIPSKIPLYNTFSGTGMEDTRVGSNGSICTFIKCSINSIVLLDYYCFAPGAESVACW